MARTAFVADEAMREKVRYLAGVGVRQDEIALIIGCAPKTLRKRFRDELDRGVAEANPTVCGYLFAAAKAGNIPAIIFWLKTRANWREGTAADAQAADARAPRADAEADSPVLLVLPDNSAMPSSARCCEMHKKITSPEDRRAPRSAGSSKYRISAARARVSAKRAAKCSIRG
jgi:hypothetical protein